MTGGEVDRDVLSAERLDSASHLARSVAHDLNNILTAMMGFGYLLAEQVAADPDASSNAREVLAAGERSAALTRHLLAFGQRQALAPAPVDVATLVEGLQPRCRAVLGPDVTLDILDGTSNASASVDAARLEDALVSLAENAGHAMPEGGRLSIGFRVVPSRSEGGRGASPDLLRITVSDTGGGIAPEVRGRIFEPFVTTKRRGEGTGLGLAVVYGFVKQSGGDIQVCSEAGQGTTFTIDLPCVEPWPSDGGPSGGTGRLR